MCLTVRHIPVLAVWWMIGWLDYLVDDIGRIGFYLVNSGIGLLLPVGCYGLLSFGELLSRRLNRMVSACLLDNFFCRSFPGRGFFQSVGFFPDVLPAPGLFCFAALHISRAPAWCS